VNHSTISPRAEEFAKREILLRFDDIILNHTSDGTRVAPERPSRQTPTRIITYTSERSADSIFYEQKHAAGGSPNRSGTHLEWGDAALGGWSVFHHYQCDLVITSNQMVLSYRRYHSVVAPSQGVDCASRLDAVALCSGTLGSTAARRSGTQMAPR